MTLFHETLYLIVLGLGFIMMGKGILNLSKVFFGMLPAPQGLREALAA